MPNVPEFSRIARWLKNYRKRWVKQKTHRANRKRLHQTDPQDFNDQGLQKRLDPWDIL